ncbi:tRNA-queuosine alpha-mannosyltransferase domain-containing protein [Mariprofundus ferrinatatus]|nr:DUF3524 domain-containing protein [Mariprofundus ferrinatatus]
MRILLLSAYDAASHRQWRQGLANNLPEHEWCVLALPPRHFSWRIRGNAFSWAGEQRQMLNEPYDLILATSMVDLATLRGIVPGLSTTPAIIYFHENQFAYPESGHAHPSVEAQITSIYSGLAADRLVFNSAYNRDSFLAGALALIRKMPDHAPTTLIDSLAAKSLVLPVPLDEACFARRERNKEGPTTLLWNHRWEYDKGPERLLLLMQKLETAGLDYRIHIIGQQFRAMPESFDAMRMQFSHRIGKWGYIEDRAAYLHILRSSDIAISTALHDFQGIAILEAVACGCTPVAPRRLAYPEFIHAGYLAESCADDADREAAAMADRIIALSKHTEPAAIDISKLAWRHMKQRYRALLASAST